MEAFRALTSKPIPLDRADVDTDQIIPAQFMKRVERSGFGRYLFHAWRQDPSFVLNDDRYRGAQILLAGANFGCGSSREHAPWALEDYGVRAVIARSFADIFRNNCAKVGILTITLPDDVVTALVERSEADPEAEITIDLEARTVRAGDEVHTFDVDPFVRDCLLEGLDQIGLTLRHEDDIAAFEARREAELAG